MPESLNASFTNVLIAALSVVLALVIAGYSWSHRKITGARNMMLMALLGVAWGLFYILQITSNNIEYKNLWNWLQFLPIGFIPSAFLIFSLAFTGRSETTRKPKWLLAYLIPTLSLLIIPTNNIHHLFILDTQTTPHIDNGLSHSLPEYGIWFWVIVIHSIILLLISVAYLAYKLRNAERWARSRISTILFGVCLPAIAGIISIPLWAHQVNPNFIQIALVSFLLIVTWSIFDNRMLDVIPLASSTLLSQMSDAVITLDPHGIILDCNNTAAKIEPLNPGEHVGESFPILLHTTLKTPVAIEDCLDQSVEIVIGEGSNTRIYDMSISPLTTSSKEVAGSLVVLREITQKKQEEVERILIEERYRTIFENSSYGILLLNQQGLIIENNNQAANISGYNREQILFHSLKDLIQDPPVLPTRVDLKTIPAHEAVLIHSNGERIPIELTVVPILQGEEIIYYVTIQDIRERKLAESITHTALENVQSRIDELALLRSVTESLNQATTLRAAILPVLETVTTITKSRHVWLFLLGKSNHAYQRIEYRPLDEDNLLAVDNLSGSLPDCLTKLIEGRIETPRTIKGCVCSRITASTSHYSLPLYIGKQPLGLMNFVDEKSIQDNDNKVRLLQTICDSLAVAIERVRLFKSEHDQRKLAETMRDIGVTLTASLDLNEILDLLLDQLSRLVPYDGGNVMLVEDKTVYVARFRGYELIGKKKASSLLSQSFNIEETENLRVIFNTRKPLIITDTAKLENWIPTDVSSFYHSWLGVPVIIEGKIEAIFCLDKVEPGFYSQEHARLVSLFANQSSLAIKNSRLFAAESKRIKELDSLRATLADISSQLDVNVLLHEIVKRAIYLLNAKMGEIGLFESEQDALRIFVSENMSADTAGTLIKIGEGIIGKAAKSKQPLNISNFQNWKGKRKDFPENAPYSELAVPMLAGDNELLGVISIGDDNPIRVFTENDIRLLNLFAQQATIALRNAQLFADARQRAEEAETIRKAGAVVVSSLNQDEAIQLILEQLAHVVPYDSASVLLHKKGKLVIVGGRGFNEANPIKGFEIPLNRSNPGAGVFLDNSPRLIPSVSEEVPNFNHITDNKYIIRSWLGVPLTIHNKPIGILSLDAHKPGQFTSEHARLVAAFADQVAIALENSRLYENAIRAATRNETLYKLSQTISANIRSEEIYPAIYEATHELMDTEFFCISLVNEKDQMIEDVYIIDHMESVELSKRPASQGLFGKVLAEGKSIHYSTFDESMITSTGAILTGNLDESEISQSVLVVPLKIGAKMIGVLSAQSYRPYAYSDSDLEMLELLGANAAIAIENARLFSEVQELAITDPVTGLYNRRRFIELAEQEFNRSLRYDRKLSTAMLDIDHFKVVNDTFGHSVGDQVLIQLAGVCRTGVRQVDILARYGGEEFMILFPETSAEEAYVIAERLRAAAAAAVMETAAGPLHITISLGVAELDKSCESLIDLVDRADFAQYASKDAGRNRVTCWTPNIVQRAKDTGVLRKKSHHPS